MRDNTLVGPHIRPSLSKPNPFRRAAYDAMPAVGNGPLSVKK